jgi:thioredoxin-like negative regulator of GroEL
MKEIDALENINFLEIDVDQHKNLLKSFQIQGVPVCILLKDGIVIDRKAGSLNYEEFMAWLGKHDLGKRNR